MSKWEKKCKDCIHCDFCKNNTLLSEFDENQVAYCQSFKDKSLFVELPMVLGQICYVPYNYKNEVEECRVSSLTQKADGSWKIRLTHNHSVFEIRADEIGETVFLTQTEAEEKLNEQKRL